jgi:hypothetical protein
MGEMGQDEVRWVITGGTESARATVASLNFCSLHLLHPFAGRLPAFTLLSKASSDFHVRHTAVYLNRRPNMAPRGTSVLVVSARGSSPPRNTIDRYYLLVDVSVYLVSLAFAPREPSPESD